ncbi:hypothetical protein ACFVTM_18850 [Arthrobacter sp. NPDC058130]|uniref:hypothetical protein n=1 Tax=Arthrobacter sp. NPDC058130 TaxID=3346353 RepID=UPI0036EF6E6A
MRHMGTNGKIAIGAFLTALALLVLTGVTLHEWVLVWFIGAAATAYVACVAEVVVRRRHKTLVASGIGSTLFIAFGVAFLRQWGLAFNPDPDALSTRVDSAHPDLYFYLAAAAGAVTLLLLFAGTVLPGRSHGRRTPGYAQRRRPAAAARGAGARSASPRPSASRPTPRGTAPRPAAPRAPARPAAKSAVQAPVKAPVKAPVRAPSGKSPAAKSPAKPPTAKSPARTSARR